MGIFSSSNPSTSSDNGPSSYSTEESNPDDSVDVIQSADSIGSRLRRRRRPTAEDRQPPRRRRTDLNSFVPMSSPLNNNSESISITDMPQSAPSPSVISSNENINASGNSVTTSQILLRQTIEQVIYNILEEQDYSRQDESRSDSSIQVFFYSGTFRVQLTPRIQVNAQTSTSTRTAGRFSISQVSSTLETGGETQEIVDYSSMRNFMARNSPQNRDIEREWISEGTLRTRLRTTHAMPPNGENNPIVELPLVMVGTPDTSSRSEMASGWIMYVIGGGTTSDIINQISEQASESNSIPAVIGSEGRLLTLLRPDSANLTFEETLIIGSLRRLRGETPQNRALGLLLASIISGLYESPDASTTSILDILASSSSSDEDQLIGGEDLDTYDLLWRLVGLIGPVVPRNVDLNLVEDQLPSCKYAHLKNTDMVKELLPDCPVCLSAFEDDSDVRILPCSHFFHKDCVDVWLSQHVNNCPLCRSCAVKTE